MNLIIDEGNTAFKLALYEKDELIKKQTFQPFERQEMHSWISDAITSIRHAMISSVVNEGLDLSRYSFNEWQLGHGTPLPIKNLYSTKQTLGKDRIANAVGAWYLNPNNNSLVIDLGTCIKYDLISEEGAYMGGNISPGVNMRFKALQHFTDQLPLMETSTIPWDYGTDTESSITNGVEQGVFHEINGFIGKYSEQFSELTIFMTGGDAKYFDKPFIVDIFAHPELTLFGLNKILTYNVEKN